LDNRFLGTAPRAFESQPEQLCGFEIRQTFLQLNNSLLKSGLCSARHF
jgi:hypothetical protein